MIVVGGIVALFTAIGGWFGWTMGTRALYRRSFDALDAPLANNPKLIRRRRVQRMLLTVVFALGGTVTGFVFLIFIIRA